MTSKQTQTTSITQSAQHIHH